MFCQRISDGSPSVKNNDYFDNDIKTPVKVSDLSNTQEYNEDHISRRIDTAATDSKSLTNTTDRKRIGKSAARRKRKNINIRKLNKKSSKIKKSTKSLAKGDPDNECIHERVEEEDNDVCYQNPFNNDLKELDMDSNIEPEKAYNVQSITSIRNSSVVNTSANYNSSLLGSTFGGKKDKKKLSSVTKPANEMVMMQKSPFESRPMTVFFQYPDYCGVVRKEDNTQEFSQQEMKKQGYSLSFKVTGSTHVYNSVVNSMKNAGFTMSGSSNWNMLWTGIPRPDTIKSAVKHQRINHYPSTMQIGRKDNMWRNIFRLKRKHGNDYDI